MRNINFWGENLSVDEYVKRLPEQREDVRGQKYSG
jgi:hypothetical protein